MLGRHPTWQYLIDWTSRMAQNYGGTVWEGDKQWDWGQAMCRGLFGEEWMTAVGFLELDELDSREEVQQWVIDFCQRWEAGEWPEWVSREKMKPGAHV